MVNKTHRGGNGLQESASVSRRLMEIACGLLVVALAIGLSKLWIEAKNSGRADSFVMRESVQLTLEAARSYGVATPETDSAMEKWRRFLASPRRLAIDPRPAHAFVDSFMIKYRDGLLDSLETLGLYKQLVAFGPEE